MLPGGDDQQPDAPAADRPISLRASLLALVAVCVLPLAAAALLLVFLQYRQGWERVGRETLLEARQRAAGLDRELAAMIAGMKVLATAPELARDDLAGWHQRATAAASLQGVDNYLLTDRQGRQRANTLRPYGTPLPASGTPPQLDRVFTEGRPVVTDLFIGPVTKRPVMAIGVPVELDGAVRYSLNIGVAPRRFQALLESQPLPQGWVASVLDGSGTIVARTREPERFVGQRAAAAVVAQVTSGGDGSIETLSMEQVRVVSSLGRSSLSDWSVAVGAPRATLESELVTLVSAAVAGVAAAVVAGLWLALRIAGRVTGAVMGLDAAARALVAGQPVTLPALRLREAEAVGQALLQASEAMQRTRHAAQHDALTGLSNRALFAELLHRQLAVASRRHGHFAVVMIDLDDLKRINDGQGHAAGDRALRATARRILMGTRAGDVAARLGGDEFAVLLTDTDPEQALATARRLLGTLATPDAEHPHALSASLGVALWPGAGHDETTLMAAADAALYAAKSGGKGRVCVAPVAAQTGLPDPGA